MKKLYIRQVAVTRDDKSEERWEVQIKRENGEFCIFASLNAEIHSYSKREDAVKAREEFLHNEEVESQYHIETHRRYQEDDYNHLKAKGYNDTEVAEIWNNDIRHDVISNLLWLRANAPNAAEKVLADFVNLKNNNPYQSNPNPNE